VFYKCKGGSDKAEPVRVRLVCCVNVLIFVKYSINTDVKNPVILVHGIFDTASRMKHIQKYLRNTGRRVYSITLTPSSGRIGIDDLANQLNEFVKTNIHENQKFDLIGFSMGGLVCRYYIQRVGGLGQIDHFITISTPNNGTIMGYLLFNKGCKQMRYNGKFINDLNKDVGQLSQLKITTIWNPTDLVIVPASSSCIHIGDEIKIRSILHHLIVRNKRCLQVIEMALLK
jgi:triacylglycerol lipase